MKKMLFLALTTLSSCTVGFNQFKGSYLDAPYQITSEKDYETVWSNVIDLFAQKGLSIKVIDKSSGLIVSEKTSFNGHCTFENKRGYLESPEAWIVVAKPRSTMVVKPEEITGEWNVRIKKVTGNSSIVNVNLTNIQAYSQVARTMYGNSTKISYPAKSTGVFEKLVADNIAR